MGENSGFPLGAVIQSVLPLGHVEDLLVPSEALAIPLHKRIARKTRLAWASTRLIVEAPKLLSTAGSPWARNTHRHIALKALASLNCCRDRVVLLPSAEEQFCIDFALAKASFKKHIFACFHQPPAWFRLNWRRFEDLDCLGGIICLGEEQAAYFRSVCTSPVFQIRHGVSHCFFRPPEDPLIRKGNQLLFVGQWLRDFETLADAMPLVWSRKPDVQLACVVPRFARNSEHLRRLAMDQRVTWYSELPDEKLRDLYQAADLLFLPLLDAVANNAVLESLSSGLPIISTHVGAMPEYLPSRAGQLCKARDARDHAETLCNWLDNPSKRRDAGDIGRNMAVERFDWHDIGIQLVKFLNSQTAYDITYL